MEYLTRLELIVVISACETMKKEADEYIKILDQSQNKNLYLLYLSANDVLTTAIAKLKKDLEEA